MQKIDQGRQRYETTTVTRQHVQMLCVFLQMLYFGSFYKYSYAGKASES